MAAHVKCMDLFIYLLLYVPEETGKITRMCLNGKVGLPV